MEKTDIKNKGASFGIYNLIKTIGGGDYSKVKIGLDTNSSQYYAVKIIKHSHPNLNRSIIKQELETLSQLKHPNIINITEFYESIDYIKKNGESYKAVAIIMELISGGGLFEYASDSRRFSEEVTRTYFQILIETFEYCYSQGITHRGLKPEHLLFDANFNLKVADWGFANLFTSEDNNNQLYTILGTQNYIPPEIRFRRPYSGTSADLFTSGIILFMMLSGNPPFREANLKTDPWYKLISIGKYDIFWRAHERNKPRRADQENFFGEEFRDLINAMLSPDPEARLDLKQIRAHPWFNGPTVELSVLRAEFLERKKQVDERLIREREAKLQKEQAIFEQKKKNPFFGIRPFVSLENEETYCEKMLAGVVNFDRERKIEEYSSGVGFKPFTQLYSVENVDRLFKLLCWLVSSEASDFTVSEDKYKIKCEMIRDDDLCTMNILITKLDDTTICTEFYKTGGYFLAFLNVIEIIKKRLSESEASETEY